MSLYLAIGGIDGSGKSSVQRMLVEHLRSRGQDVVGFAEPYHSFVKELLELTDDPWADVLLFALDRRLLRPSIQQWRSEDRTMVCSRAMYCSVAYQSAQGVPWEDILKANQWESLILPDLYFILDADPKLAFPRCSGREKFERESFLADVREQYREIYRRRQMFPSRMIMVDAGRPLEQVYRSVLSAVEKEMEG
jgi:dTMP kinase